MKKRIAALLMIAAVVSTLVAFAACNGNNLEKYRDRLSDYRYAALRVTDERFTLDVISGVHETPYTLDGTSAAEKTEYTVFTLKPLGDFAAGLKTVPLSVTVNGTAYDLQLAAHPFKGSYSTEVAASLAAGECGELKMTLSGEEFTAAACAPDAIDGEYALTVALDAAGDSLKGRKDYEIYLRLTENTITAAGGWYWFASFAGAEESVSVLINAVSGEVTAVRN